MMDINKCMTPRLRCVASFAEPGCSVADIGTDHAYIPIWLIGQGIAQKAIAMDINQGPILRAEENIRKFSMTDTIQTRLSDGLERLLPGETDTVVIAGMGGMLINDILDAGKHLYSTVRHFILQPMTAIEETRKYLAKNGFLIQDERLAQEDEKIYCVLSVVRGEMQIMREIDFYIGRRLMENKDPLLPAYLDGKIYEYEKAIQSLKKADTEKAGERLAHFSYLCEQMYMLREECALW